MARVTGFSDLHVSTGRTLLKFSGNAAQVLGAFHTTIHKYKVDGREHWANATDALIPAALAPLIAGVGALHNFPVRIGDHAVRSVSRRNSATPQTNIPSPCEASGLQATGACFRIRHIDRASETRVRAAVSTRGVTQRSD
jgi:hypothetical protein